LIIIFSAAPARQRTNIIIFLRIPHYIILIAIEKEYKNHYRKDMMPENAALPEELAMYIRLVWLFVFLITILMLFLCYLFLAMRRAEKRESQSLAFSHLAIEGLETERRRVSRELHDTVLPLVKDAQVSALIRSICVALMPPDFTRLSLNDSLADLCGQFMRRAGIECACSIEDGSFASFRPENQLQLYRIVQESFTNIEKHSKARRAALVVRRLPEHILICVSDDGVGLPGSGGRTAVSRTAADKGADIPAGAGLGIRSMLQRATILGAKLEFKSESGNGLMVRVELSCSAQSGSL
jgi:two-component system NarL family sensor kinase